MGNLCMRGMPYGTRTSKGISMRTNNVVLIFVRFGDIQNCFLQSYETFVHKEYPFLVTKRSLQSLILFPDVPLIWWKRYHYIRLGAFVLPGGGNIS